MKLLDQSGNPLHLDREIGRGGEGIVYTLQGDVSSVAKIYHTPPAPDHVQKLQTMVEGATPELLEVSAWPRQLLFNGGVPAGFVCPRFSGCTEIHHLYNPKARKTTFPKVGWHFLIHTALNLANTFRAVHAHRHAIGDVNDRNILVTSSATVKLLDCDSFQIGTRFPCKVGMVNFLPPELQNRPMETFRTANHDNFSLAVFIFNLLFMGRHPFSGRYKRHPELALHEAIAKGLFAYDKKLAAEVAAPLHSVPFEIIPESLQTLFLRAFSLEASHRPESGDWIHELSHLKKQIVQCAKVDTHQYLGKECPWCSTANKGFDYFLPSTQPLLQGSKNVQELWRTIQNVGSPGPLPSIKITPPKVTPKPVIHVFDPLDHFLTWLTGCISTFFLILSLFQLSLPAFLCAVTCGIPALYLFHNRRDDKQVRINTLTYAQEEWELGKKRWKAEGSEAPYKQIYHYLNTCKDKLVQLDSAMQNSKSHKQELLKAFLEKQLIVDALIPQIGPSTKFKLATHGILTAADIQPHTLEPIPGLVKHRTLQLLFWRGRLENDFYLNEKKFLQDFEREKQELIKTLQDGPFKLQTACIEIQHRRRVLGSLLINLATNLRQAQEDWKHYQEVQKRK